MMLQIIEREKILKRKVVVDTSILISAVIVDGAYRKLLRKLIAANFELYIPQEVIDEFQEVVKDKKFQKYYPLFVEIFDELRQSSILLPHATQCKHMFTGNQEDESIVNCCIENKIDYLITSDKKTIGRYNGLEVIFAQEFYCSFLSN